jgi:hypothetical protein
MIEVRRGKAVEDEEVAEPDLPRAVDDKLRSSQSQENVCGNSILSPFDRPLSLKMRTRCQGQALDHLKFDGVNV